MSAMTDFLETGLQDHFRRDTQLPLEDTYIALLTADPTETGSTANEVSASWYSRQQVHQATATTPYWTSATAGNGIENNSAVTFGTATTTVTGVSHMMIMDASTGGNGLLKTALNTAKTINNNDPVEFAAGDASFTFD